MTELQKPLYSLTVGEYISLNQRIFKEMKEEERNSAAINESDQLLNIQQAASFLSLSVPTLYDRVHKQTIPVCKRPGTKRLYFSKKALTDYILEGKRPTIVEIQAKAEAYINGKKR